LWVGKSCWVSIISIVVGRARRSILRKPLGVVKGYNEDGGIAIIHVSQRSSFRVGRVAREMNWSLGDEETL
jgi:hypothetical protein